MRHFYCPLLIYCIIGRRKTRNNTKRDGKSRDLTVNTICPYSIPNHVLTNLQTDKPEYNPGMNIVSSEGVIQSVCLLRNTAWLTN